MSEPGPTIDLTDAADRMRIRPGDADTVVARARHRTRRRRQATSILAAVAVVASVPVAQRLTSPSEEETPVAASGAVQRGLLGMTWRRVDVAPQAGVGFARGLSSGKPVYAISSAPGERMVEGRDVSRVVWRSDDGIEWSAVSTLGPDLYLADLSTRDDRVYAVGTVPAQATVKGRPPQLRSSDVVIGWSDDGGRQWNRRKLSFDMADHAPTLAGGTSAVEVAAGPKGVVAVVALWADLDVPRLLPDGATAPHGWATTSTGVDVLGPERDNACPEGYRHEETKPTGQPVGEILPTWCYRQETEATITVPPQRARSVVASYTWEQLGVGGDLLRAVRRQPVAFYAEPGSTDFRRVELPDTGYLVGTLAVEAGEHGFDLVASTGSRGGGADQLVLLRSTDGRTWAKESPPGIRRWSAGLGALGGRAAMVTADEEGASFTVADGESGWRSAVLNGAVDPRVLEGRRMFVGQAAFGPFGVAVHMIVEERDERGVSHRLVVSRDGETWDDVALDDVLGASGGSITRIAVTDDGVVVTTSLPERDGPNRPRRQVVVVGTAA